MQKVAIVTTQMLIGLFVVTLGAAALVTPEGLSQELASIGFGETVRLAIGVLQMFAGFCLMVPRGHVAATAILALVAAGMAVFAIVQTPVEAKAAAPQRSAAIGEACGLQRGITVRSDWKI